MEAEIEKNIQNAVSHQSNKELALQLCQSLVQAQYSAVNFDVCDLLASYLKQFKEYHEVIDCSLRAMLFFPKPE